MRERGKRLLALGLVLSATLGVTGLQSVFGQEVYHAPELVLLEGETEYDLLSGIEYDTDQYTLNLANDGGFDVHTLGTYTLEYELMPQSTQQPTVSWGIEAEQVDTQAVPVSFTRQVVVEEAVSYGDLRLEQGSTDLLDGITVASEAYQVAVVSDGGFDPNQIKEYEVTYSLSREDSGRELRRFTRYVQVTQPGVEFTAPELVVEGDVADQDWLDGIEYDYNRYTLTLLTQPDSAKEQPQRLYYALNEGDTVAAIFGRKVTVLGEAQPVADLPATQAESAGVNATVITQDTTIDVSTQSNPIQIDGNITLTLTGTGTILPALNTGNAIDIVAGKTVTIEIAEGANVTLYGEDATAGGAVDSVGHGGGAAIHVPEGAILHLTGTGSMTAYGGAAGKGGDPTNRWYAGAGGGGAGAAIGGNGGNGGGGGYYGRTQGADSPVPEMAGMLRVDKETEAGLTMVPGPAETYINLTRVNGAAAGGGGMGAVSLANLVMPSLDGDLVYAGIGGGGGGGGSAGGSSGYGSWGGGGWNDGQRTTSYSGYGGWGGASGTRALSMEIKVRVGNTVAGYQSLALAFQDISLVAKNHPEWEEFEVYFADPAKGYTMLVDEWEQIVDLSLPETVHSIVLSSQGNGTVGAGALVMAAASPLVFPASENCQFTVEQINLKASSATVIAANGSSLTMGEGITVTGTLDVVGGGSTAKDTGDYTFTGSTNLTVLSGTYRFVAGGSRPTLSASGTRTATTQGNTQVTVGGTTVVSNAVVGGNLLSATSTPWTKSVVNGSTSITFTGEAQSANIYAGSTSISYPNYMQTDTVTGTSTVAVSGGTITNILGGTAATYNATSGQLNQVVFQINGAQTIPTVQDFDQLVLAQQGHLTISTKLHYKVREVESDGQVVFGAGSQLTTPGVAAASLTVGSLKTEGEGAVLELTKNYRLYVDAADTPMNASGGSLGLKYKSDAAPASGNILVQYNNAKSEANWIDYAYKFPQGGLMLSADAVNGYIMLGASNVSLTTPSGSTTQWVTAAEAYQEIVRVAGEEEPGVYRVDLLKNYTWTAADQAALTALTELEAGDTLTMTGDPQQTGAGVYLLTLAANTDVIFPANSDAHYGMERIKIAGGTRTIVANGSSLTMGEGITVTGALDVAGGSYTAANPEGDTYTFHGDTDLTLLSGTYRYVAAGSRPYVAAWTGTVDTQGHNHLTLGGGSGTVTVTEAIGLNLIGYGSGDITNAHTGSATVTIKSGAVVTSVHAGSRGTNYNAYHTDVQTEGTITIQVEGGQIKTLLGGTPSTKANAGQLEWVVFQINGQQTIPTVRDFDQLILLEDAYLTVSSSLVYNGSGKEVSVEGQVVFRANATLRVPSAGRTVGSLKTEGSGATVEVYNNSYPLMVAGATPIDSKNSPLGVKYWYGTAANGYKLIYYTNADAPAMNSRDYVARDTASTLILSSDATGDYLQYATVKVQLTDPNGETERYGSFADTFRALYQMKQQDLTGEFTVALLMEYGTWTAADREALLALDNLTADDSVVITGKSAPDASKTYGFGITYTGSWVPCAFELPMNSDCPFTFEYININGSGTVAHVIAANGTPLTMGEGITITSYITLIGGAIARDENFAFVDEFTFTGDTNLTIKSGTYYEISGGNLASNWNAGADKITLNGSANITIDGPVTVTSSSNGGVSGGSYGYYNVGKSDFVVTGDVNITIRGDVEIPYLTAGSRHRFSQMVVSDVVEGTTKVTFEADEQGNTPTINTIYGTSQFVTGGGKLAQTIYEFGCDMTVGTIYDFDQLVLDQNIHLTVSALLQHQYAESEEPSGTIVFGEASTLTLPSTATAGSLKTAGPDAVLEIRRGYPLNLSSSTDSSAGKLVLRYTPNTTQGLNGDKLLYFRTQPNLADSSHYISGFPNRPGMDQDQVTGYVIVATNIITLQTNGGTETYYPNVAAAMEQIEALNNANNNYTITVRKQHYTMTEEDLQAIDQFNGKAKSITFTSTFKLTSGDLIGSGESVGQMVSRHVIIDGDLSFRSDTTLQNIYLEYQGHDGSQTTTVSHNIYANGHSLTMGVGVDTGSGNYPTLYGGSKTEAVTGTTNLTVQSGTYEDIYGGGQQEGASVTGTNIRYEEFAVLNGSLYGGGKAGDVNGDVSVVISGGTTGGQTDSKVIAGGETGDVSGTAQLTISGGTAGKTMVVAGADNGTVVNAAISILEPSDGAQPSAPKAHVYGGAYGSGSVTGTASVTIDNGTYYGTISGGDLDGGIGGHSTISFSGSELKMENLVNFSTLNLGYGGSKCNLTVTGQLDSNTATSGNFDRTGHMVFNSGSILNLTGKSAHKVGSIQTTTTGGASHLHISKAEEVSYPLYISEGNSSEAGYTINVGIPDSESAPDTSRPAAGDDVLIFAEQNQVDMSQYLCGLTLLGLVQNQENPAIVELGVASDMQAKLTAVSHYDKADTTTEGSKKTLSFLFSNVGKGEEELTAPESAYIDHSATADEVWAKGGAVPAGALGGELTSFTAVEGVKGQWTGQITLDEEAMNSQTSQLYYLHVRGDGAPCTIVLDVYGPQVNKDVTSSSNGQGDYTFTIQVQDKTPAGISTAPESENAPVFENAGLYQVGWSLVKHDSKALAVSMAVNGVQTIPSDNVWLPYDWTFEVTAQQLAQAETIGSSKVIYLYLKDTLGNTRMITVPMSEHQIDVSIPTRVGVVAMTGVDTPKVNAPQCALINYGSQAVKASVTQVSFTEKDNELKLVTRPGSPNSAFDSAEIDLRIKPLAGEQGYAYSLANLTTPQAQPLSMGQMAAYSSEGTANQLGFTFDALYNPQTIVETGSWSMFYLSYRFEAVGSTTQP